MLITAEKRYEGETIPPWYYGLAYKDWYMQCEIWYPIPINYLVIIGKRLKYYWDVFRKRKTWMDKQVQAKAKFFIDYYYSKTKEEDATNNKVIDKTSL